MGKRAALVLATAAVSGAAPVAAAIAALSPSEEAEPLWVLTAPGISLERVLDRAGARAIGPVRPRFGGIVTGGPDLAPRLRAAGALLVLPAGRLAFICGANT